MKLQPCIVNLESKSLVGISANMSVVNDSTLKLFQTFMPRRKEILNVKNTCTYDLRVYPNTYFQSFNPSAEFKKFALAEVSSIEEIPHGMQVFHLVSGQYAVFKHQGPITDNSIFQYIFTNWLPNSTHQLDNRPHFELMGAKVKFDDPDAEEEIWIPVVASNKV